MYKQVGNPTNRRGSLSSSKLSIMWRRSSRRRQGLFDKESEWTDSPDLSSHKFERSILRPLVRTPMDENGKDRRWDSLYSMSRTRSSGRSSDSLMCKRHRSLPRVTRTISGDPSPEQKVLLDLQSFITSQKHLLEKAEWGDNTRAVKFYLRCQKQQHKSIVQFGRDIDKAGSMVDTIPTHLKKAFQDDFERISEQYSNLLPLSNQRLTNMEQLAWFSSQAERLILWLDEKEKHEVNYDWSQSNIRRKRDAYLGLLQDLEKQEVELTVVQKEGEKLLNLFHPAVYTIEEILFEVEKKWRWVLQLCHCIFSHVQENTAYWQFFRDAHAAEKVLRELHKLIKMMMVHPPGPHKTLRKQIQGIQERIEEMEVIVQSLSNKSTEIVQLKPRCPDNLITSLLPLKAVCDYTLNGMLVCQREHVYLLKDNKHRVSWLVLLPGGVEIIVPSVCYIILPPNKHAINISNRIQEMLTETKIYWIKCSADLNIIQLWYLLQERMSRVMSWTIEEVEQQNHNDLQEVMDKVEKLYNKLLESRSETGILQTWHYEQMNEDMSTCRRIYKNLIISLGQTNSIPRAWRERSIRLSIERRSQSSSTSMSPEPYSFWDKSPRLQSPLFNEGRMLQRAGTLPASRELSPTMQYWGKSSPKYTSDDDVFSPEPPHKLARNSMTPTARKAQGQGKVPTNLDTVRLAMDQMKDVMETSQLQRQAAIQGSEGDLVTAEQDASNLKQMHEEPSDGVIVDPGLKNEAWEEQRLHKETHLSNEEECLEAQLEILRGSVEEARAGQERAETEAALHQAHSDELHQKILQVEHKVQKLEASERDALKSRQEALQEAERLKQDAEMAYQREHLGNGEVGYENQAEAVKLQEEVKQTRMELAQFEAQLQQQLERAATYQELAQQEARAKEVAQAEAMSLWRSAEKEAELRKAAEVEAQELRVVAMKEMERYRFAVHEAEEARKKLQEELCRLHIEVKSTSREKASLEEQQRALRADVSHMRTEKDQTLAELCLLKAKMEAMMKQCPKESSFCEDFIDELLEKEVEEPSIWTAKSEVAFTPPSQEKEIECTFPIAITTHPESTSIPSCPDQGLSQKPPCPNQELSRNPPYFDEELSLKPPSPDQVLSLKFLSSNEELSLKPLYPDQDLSLKPTLPNHELSLKPSCCDQELFLKFLHSNDELSLKSPYPDQELSLKPPGSDEELSLKPVYPDQELSLKPPCADQDLSVKLPCPNQGLCLNYSMVSSMENSSGSTSRPSQDDSPAFTSSDVHHKVNDLPEVQKAGRCDILALDKMTTEHVEMKECKEHAEQLGERTLSLPWELVDNGLKLNTHKKSHISFQSLSSTPSPAVEKTCCITNSKIYEKNDQHVTCRKLETGDQHGLDVQHEGNWHIRPCLQEGLETEYNERHFEIDDDSLRHIMQTNQEACGDPTKEKEILACTLKRTKEQGIRFIGETVEEGNCEQ
uniref:Desmoplakin SH3 domain-containing protein n=1 Tax=Eptatretus burgeri TaxID=7764 RepID=A0A8C4R3S4_EPTBU